MSHKETILYSLKMIDNLVRKLMDRHITADKQGLTIMHTWIVGFLYNNPDRAVYQRVLNGNSGSIGRRYQA